MTTNKPENHEPWPLSTLESSLSWKLESFLGWRLTGFSNELLEDHLPRKTSGGSRKLLVVTPQPSQEKVHFRDDIGLQGNHFAD
jgi:hypothetical protein